MTKSGLLIVAMVATPTLCAGTLFVSVTANATTRHECELRRGYCKGGCSGQHRELCTSQCDEVFLTCLEGADQNSTWYPERPNRGRPITGTKPQGVKPTGGLLDTTPGLPGQGPASTGGAVINARPSAPPQIR
jgi:hypothetical protein